MAFKIMRFKCFLKVSNDFKFLMFADRLFHSLGAATQ